MRKNINIRLGFAILTAWMGLIPLWFLTNESFWLALWLLLTIFLSPFWLQLIVELVGKDKIESVSRCFFNCTLKLLSIALITGAVGFTLFQAYSFLKVGNWVGYSVIDGLVFLDSEWAAKPQDWLGVWKILRFIPVSASVFLVGIIVYSAAEK